MLQLRTKVTSVITVFLICITFACVSNGCVDQQKEQLQDEVHGSPENSSKSTDALTAPGTFIIPASLTSITTLTASALPNVSADYTLSASPVMPSSPVTPNISVSPAMPASPSVPAYPPSAGSVNPAAFVITGNPENASGASWTYKSTDDGVIYDLKGSIIKPTGNGPFPAVILSHGLGGSAQSIINNIGTKMVKWGVTVIAVNYTHANANYAQGSPGSAEDSDYGASAANILRARKCFDILSTLPYVDITRVAAHGHSMGAFLTGGLVGTYPSLFIAASHTAGGSLAAGQTNYYCTTPQQATGIKTPYLLLHGTADTVVDIRLAENMYAILKGNGIETDLIRQEGITHNNIASTEITMNYIREWYSRFGMFR